MTAIDFAAAFPLILLALTGAVCLLLEVSGIPVGARKLSNRGHIAIIAVLGLLGSAAIMAMQFGNPRLPLSAFHGAIRVDNFGLFMGIIISVGAALAVMVAVAWLRSHSLERGEYYSIIVFTAAGMIALSQASDSLFLFVALETLSVGVYILTGFDRSNSRSPEAAMKYFLNGAFAAAILLFGLALLYGATGTTALNAIGSKLHGGHGQVSTLAITGFVLVMLGLAFKIAAFPLHMWTPDVYEGAPAPATAFMAAGVKAAAFAALIRVLVAAMGGVVTASEGWITAGWIIAVLTMSVGNLAALAQSKVKRMLAYSSIAHAGYALAGVVAFASGHITSLSAVGFYLMAYTFMTVGSFGVVAFLERSAGAGTSYEEWSGAARRYPLVGLAMTVFVFSLAGIPPTVGFLAKFNLFSQIVDAKLYWLAFIAVLNSLVSVYYYLRVIVAMYFKEPHEKLQGSGNAFLGIGLAVAALLVLLIGMLPNGVLDYAAQIVDVVKG